MRTFALASLLARYACIGRNMMVFIDTEVDPRSGQVRDYGAVREDGATLHTHSQEEFLSFVEPCHTVVGHNIMGFDLKHIQLQQPHTYIDTLFLSPLLFPKKPYHRLVKDDKLQKDSLNNPVNDAQKARTLYYDELSAWQSLSPRKRAIYSGLLGGCNEFEGFLKSVAELRGDCNEAMLLTLIREEYEGRLCSRANLSAVIRKYPVELAYTLAVVGTDDLQSMTPAWVLRNYPRVSNVMDFLLNTPCGECAYCHRRLDAHQGLRDFFGYTEFRLFDGEPMQQRAVESAIRGESLLAVFPTGGGKSLTFQLPALLAGRNIHGLTVVISPLQSLMKDQVDNLAERGISDAVAINGLLDPIERALAIAQVADGTANLLYISPEMLRSNTIERLLMSRTVVRFVIDEAHCFSAWGHDFRVDYLYIGDFIRRLQEQKQMVHPIAISCFTATAKQKVISDICDYFRDKLGLHLKLFAASAERTNLHYAVIHADTHHDKYSHLRNLIVEHQCPTIVYVSRTRRTHLIAEQLRQDGIHALPYNGKMDAKEKVAHQEAFMSGEAQVIVATSAFGMGVDKKDVGLVIHYDISDSLENYVQEAGRAGRDPQTQASCYVLFSDNDLDKHFILLNQTKLSLSEIQQVWQAIKTLTQKRASISVSPLDIARQAGWNDEVDDVETRIKAAIAALEEAGYVERGNNAPRVFATGITVGNMDEARQRLQLSRLFDTTTREEAARIIRTLISSRARANAGSQEAESRVDYLADMLGMTKEAVIHHVNLMRQEGLLADTKDMQAWVPRDIRSRLSSRLQLEKAILSHLDLSVTVLHYKQLNEDAERMGIKQSSVRTLRQLVRFLSLKGYVRKEEHTATDSVSIQLQTTVETTLARHERRATLCRTVAEQLMALTDRSGLANFSEVALLKQCNKQQTLQLGAEQQEYSLSELEEALLYMSKTELMRIEGGFIVIYNTMRLYRLAERRAHYGKEQYRMLDEFYRQRIQQIHIVGEYANLMVRDYDAALQYVSDYFTMDYRRFINKYFKEERRAEIDKNITPRKYHQLFDDLSERQRAIIDDKQSSCIVVAAGPGSGKTRVLVHKLASLLLLEDVKHEQLLMLTFSRAAATEFKQRLIALVGNAAHFVDITTFHSYSFDLLGRQGTLEEADSVVQRAAEMIEQGEVEEAKIAKSVLVIDEAQDMSADDYHLICALMQRYPDMRVIAVGDDDQNIYAFRGSDSRYLRSLADGHGATLYEMTANYRSDRAIVGEANRYVQHWTGRLKQSPLEAVSEQEGSVSYATSIDWAAPPSGQTTAYLTATNEQALQVAYQWQQRGFQVRLMHSSDSFRLINLAEVRYFLKQLHCSTPTISRQQWEEAKHLTQQTYASSRCLPLMKSFFARYEATHRDIFFSDLRLFLLESNPEDFFEQEQDALYVGTIHRAKGREFDNVHLLLGSQQETADWQRTIYVGMTRARHHLTIYPTPSLSDSTIVLSLTMRDVWLDYFRDRKEQVLRTRSGDPLRYANGYLIAQDGTYLSALSSAMRERILSLTQRGYSIAQAEASYILAWRPREETTEVAVCLANLFLTKHQSQ